MSAPISRTSAEFDVIQRYFTGRQKRNLNTPLGIGDDGAVLRLPEANQSMVVVADTLVSGVHFFKDTNPYRLGHKSLAVNLSDLVAMGAMPHWFTLCLTLESIDETWLSEFSSGLFSLANQLNVQLVGGDTTCGPLNISIQAMGAVASNSYVTRSGARVGDDIWVTGRLGEAALGLALLKGGGKSLEGLTLNESQRAHLVTRLERPDPRCDWAQPLSGFASSAIDISDGLGQDLTHICEASKVSAKIDLTKIPVFDVIDREVMSPNLRAKILRLALTGGDDYELCFTANSAMRSQIIRTSNATQTTVTRIGVIETGSGVHWDPDQSYPGFDLTGQTFGYEHFYD